MENEIASRISQRCFCFDICTFHRRTYESPSDATIATPASSSSIKLAIGRYYRTLTEIHMSMMVFFTKFIFLFRKSLQHLSRSRPIYRFDSNRCASSWRRGSSLETKKKGGRNNKKKRKQCENGRVWNKSHCPCLPVKNRGFQWGEKRRW